MQKVQLATTGVSVSEMCLGTMMFGERCDAAEAERILATAMERGVDFIDTAAMYGNGLTEEILGRILPGRRDRLFIATKVHKGIDGDSIRSSLDESLARMGLDHVDLYLIHWPKPGMRPVEMMQALNDLVRQGKSRYVGCCNFPAWLFAHFNAVAAQHGWARLICNQIPYNLIERGAEVEVLPQAFAEQVAITVYRPLLIGVLAGKYRAGTPPPADSRGQRDPRVARWLDRFGAGLERYHAFAAQRGLHPAQLAVAWLRHSPAVTCPIVGVSAHQQLEASIGAFEIELNADEMATVTAMFDTAMQEESGGSYAPLRRAFDLLA